MKHHFTSKRSWLLGTAAFAVALAGPAYAQEATAEEDEEVTLDTVQVTGIRGALKNAAAIKENSTSIIEAISAEDIGKLPDVSIAESLARLPGVAVQRIDGRGQQISIRGLGPDFTSATLNGREQVTTGDNRGVEFDQFPAELLSGVVVYKTPDAQLIGQGLMGTVDLRTIRPLSQGERVISGGARYEWNDQGALNAGSPDDGYRFNAAYVDQFANDTIGVALGLATMSTPTQANIFNAWGYPGGPDGDLIIGGAKPYAKSNELKRTGVVGTFEYEPTDTFSTSVDLFYSDFEEEQFLRGVELPLWWSAAQLQPGFTSVDGFVTDGQFNNVKGVVRNDVNVRTAELFSAGWNAEWQATDKLTLGVDVSTSMVEREDVLIESYSGTGPNGVGATDELGFSFNGDFFVFNPTLDYGDPSLLVLTSPQGWGTDAGAGRPFGQAGYFNNPTIEDELSALRLTAEYDVDFGIFSSLELGANFNTREKTKVANEFFLAVADGQPSAAIPQNLIVGSTNFDFVGLGPIVSYDPRAVISAGLLDLTANDDDDVITKSWQVEEEVNTFYAMLNVDAELGEMPLTGNIGVQFVNAEQSSTGGIADEANAGSFVLTTEEGSTDEVLPSLNLSLEVMDGLYARVSVARTLARPRMDDLRVSRTLNRDDRYLTVTNPVVGQAYFTADGGNPQLQPYTADGFDLSIEKFFGDGGYVAAAVFHKSIGNWAFDATRPADFSAFTSLVPADQLPGLGSTTGFLSAPINVSGGSIEGLELSAQVPFETFADALEGFGVNVSASFTDSEITPNPAAGPISVPGLSETVVNTTAYYENNGFGVRVSNRYRSDFLGEVSGFGFDRTLRTVEEESLWDAQLTLDLGEMSFAPEYLDGLSFFLQGINLTDEPFRTFNGGDSRQVIDHQEYGSTYLVGFSYTFD